MRFTLTAATTLACLTVGPALAQDHAQPYAGQDSRAITSLSDSDIAALRAGEGWGLAKPAELNGVPGPAHVLELAQEIGLSDAQIAQVQAIHARMQAAAIREGARLIAAEAALDALFRDGRATPDSLSLALAEAGAARTALRMVHLAAHLDTAPLLSPHQIASYNRLRGYGAADPCEAVPAGHDATMWRKHNGCG